MLFFRGLNGPIDVLMEFCTQNVTEFHILRYHDFFIYVFLYAVINVGSHISFSY